MLCREEAATRGSPNGAPRLTAIAICVPVRNEQLLLPSLIEACGALTVDAGKVALCLYLDGCSDGSAAVATEAAASLPLAVHVESGPLHPDANAGRARRAAMEIGLRALGGVSGGLLMSTDADSRPEPDWVQAAYRALAVADVAAGRLVRLGGGRDLHQTRVELYYDRLHAHRRMIDPTPWDTAIGCHYGSGANLAIRAETYRALGGFRAIPAGEDAALLDDASRAGWRVRREPAMVVRTSSRRHGRAPGGLAAALESMDAHGPPGVPHPGAADWQYRNQALARRTFAALALSEARETLGRAIGLDGDHVLGVGRDCPNAEAFCMRVVPAAPGGERLVSLAEAEEALLELQQDPCERAA